MLPVGIGCVLPTQSTPTTTQVFAFGHEAAKASSWAIDPLTSCHVAPSSGLVSSCPDEGTKPVVAVDEVPAATQVVPAHVTPRRTPTPGGRTAAVQVDPPSVVVAIVPLPRPGPA